MFIALTLSILCLQRSIIFAKNVVDFDDNDIERLYRQWEDDEDEDEHEDEPSSSSAYAKRSLDDMMEAGKLDPEELLKQSKKGKPVMLFVSVRSPSPDQAYTEQVSARWMQSLQNAHIQVQRYIVAPSRVLFVVEDGSLAWKVKDYLITSTECTTVSFEQLSFDCKDTKDEL